jgi:hypothetical protein
MWANSALPATFPFFIEMEEENAVYKTSRGARSEQPDSRGERERAPHLEHAPPPLQRLRRRREHLKEPIQQSWISNEQKSKQKRYLKQQKTKVSAESAHYLAAYVELHFVLHARKETTRQGNDNQPNQQTATRFAVTVRKEELRYGNSNRRTNSNMNRCVFCPQTKVALQLLSNRISNSKTSRCHCQQRKTMFGKRQKPHQTTSSAMSRCSCVG